jgi:hypothetical protein
MHATAGLFTDALKAQSFKHDLHPLPMASKKPSEANTMESSKAEADPPPPLAALFLIKFDLKVGSVRTAEFRPLL